MNKHPFVSVVLPTWRETPFIDEAVDRLLNQTGDFSLEVLVVHNGRDSAWADELRRRYTDAYPNSHIADPQHIGIRTIRLLFCGKKGVAAARNLGVREARGKWIAFCDDDDYYTAGFFENCLKALNADEEEPSPLYIQGIARRWNTNENGELSEAQPTPYTEFAALAGEDILFGGKNATIGGMPYTESEALILANLAYNLLGKLIDAAWFKSLAPFDERMVGGSDALFWFANQDRINGIVRIARESSEEYVLRMTSGSLSFRGAKELAALPGKKINTELFESVNERILGYVRLTQAYSEIKPGIFDKLIGETDSNLAIIETRVLPLLRLFDGKNKRKVKQSLIDENLLDYFEKNLSDRGLENPLDKRYENPFRKDRFFYAALIFISACALLMMIKSGAYTGLWGDEFDTLAKVNPYAEGFFDWINTIFTVGRDSLVYFFFARLWADIGPANDIWLLLMSELMIAVSVFVVGLIGRIVHSNAAGIVSAILFGFSYNVFEVGHEFRYYSWIVLFTALSIYFYCKTTIDKKPKTRWIVLFGLAVGFAVSGQILAAFLPICLFVLDVFLIARRKKQKRHIFAYLVALPFGAYPFISFMMQASAQSGTTQLAYLMDASFTNLFNIMGLMLFGKPLQLLYALAAASALLLACTYISGRITKPWLAQTELSGLGNSRKALLFGVITFAPMVSIVLNFALMKATDGIANMFAGRYFQYLYPLFYLAIGIVIVQLADTVSKGDRKWTYVLAFVLFLYFAPQAYASSLQNPLYPGIKHKAEWIVENQDKLGDITIMAPVINYYGNVTSIIDKLYFEGKYNAGQYIVEAARDRIQSGNIEGVDSETVVVYLTHQTAPLEEMLRERYYKEEGFGDSDIGVWRIKEPVLNSEWQEE